MSAVRVRVRGFDRKDENRWREVDMLVDTGSNMAVIPSEVVRELAFIR